MTSSTILTITTMIAMNTVISSATVLLSGEAFAAMWQHGYKTTDMANNKDLCVIFCVGGSLSLVWVRQPRPC